MKRSAILVAFLLASCVRGSGGNGASIEGGLDIGVQTEALLSTQHFCFVWQVYQLTAGEEPTWELVDSQPNQVCAGDGVDTASDFGVCYDGRRFLVTYTAYLYDGAELVATLQATSGGALEDVCVKDTDTPTSATIQFANPGDVGGVNPSIDVDQICFNDKLEHEGDQLVSALWLQPENCGLDGGAPDMYCALATAPAGSTLHTARTGLSSDNMIRYIFNTSPEDEPWHLYYLAFDDGLAPSTLHLYNSPWVRMHYSEPSAAPPLAKFNLSAIGAWYYENDSAAAVGEIGAGDISAGFVIRKDADSLVIVYDQSAACNAAIATDAQYGGFDLNSLLGCVTPEIEGVIATGATTFDVVVSCGPADIRFIPCDASMAGICPATF